MIGKPEWFTYRMFGWGVAPKTKEGWFYILAGMAIAVIIAVLPVGAMTKSYLIAGLMALIVVDVLHIMTQLDKHHDERERLHQLIIERNCSFAAVAAIVIIAIYQSIRNLGSIMPFDSSLIYVLGAMLAAKIATSIYVRTRM
jgi:hypothetical protein